MRSRPYLVALITLTAPFGCSDDGPIGTGRADSGVATVDGGLDSPLLLQAGWTFTYDATLTRREGNQEKTAAYSITLTIDAVDDQGAAADSTATVRVTGAQTFDNNWDATAGFDSWVARLGPAARQDRVGAAPVTFNLSQPPGAPAAPKQLPSDRIFFIDVRRLEAIGAAWNTEQAGLSPGLLPPDPPGRPTHVFQINGDDPSLQFYPAAVKKRNVQLAYNERGYLVSIDERLGDSFDTINPNGSFTLRLKSGPE